MLLLCCNCAVTLLVVNSIRDVSEYDAVSRVQDVGGGGDEVHYDFAGELNALNIHIYKYIYRGRHLQILCLCKGLRDRNLCALCVCGFWVSRARVRCEVNE